MSPLSLRWTYLTLVVVLFLAGLDQTILATALPVIVRDLGGNEAQLSWVFSAYLMASTAVIALYGKLADRIGARTALLIATALFLLGSLACGLARSMDALIAARALQGLGGGGLMTLTMVAVARLYPPEQRGRRMGLLGAAYGVATMVGPLIGGLLVQHASWRWAFLLNVPVAVVAWGVLARVRWGAPALQPRPLDVTGAALLAAALVTLLLATRHDLQGTFDPTALPLLASAVVLTALWAAVERRAADPIVPFSLFASAPFDAVAVISTITGVALFSTVLFLPLYLQTVLHETPTSSAAHLFPLMLGITGAAVRGGQALRGDASVRRLSFTATVALIGSFVALATVMHLAPANTWAMSACLLPLGAGLGLLFPMATIVAQRSVMPQHLGVATAMPVMLRALGGAVGVSVLGIVVSREVAARLGALTATPSAETTGAAMAGGLQVLFIWVAVVCVGACLATRWLPSRLPAGAAVAPSAALQPT